MRKMIIFLTFAVLGVSAYAGDLPLQNMTPGATSTAVTQENIKQTVCVKGYTKTVRPPAFFTNRLKKQQIKQYGYADTNPKDYEEDHLIALALGGAPDDPRNLWPQPRKSEWGSAKKDQLEVVLMKMVCANEITLQDAQQAISSNWIDAWKRYVPSYQRYRVKAVD